MIMEKKSILTKSIMEQLIKANSEMSDSVYIPETGDTWYKPDLNLLPQQIGHVWKIRRNADDPYYSGSVGRIEQIRRLRYLVKTGQITLRQAIRMYLK